MAFEQWDGSSCDTMVAVGTACASAGSVFGKNSDRPPRESQPLVYNEAKAPADDAVLDLAYCRVPERSETYATLGAAPYWCWGYEMGVNEHGVTIGNEAVYTRPLAADGDDREEPDDYGVVGMEYVRLGLERGRTASEAVEVIGGLLEEHGQYTPTVAGGKAAETAYDNSYLVADGREAWVLETAGRNWAARRIRDGTAAISNQLTIGDDWTSLSDGAVERAVDRGWWPAGERPFDFAAAFADPDVEAYRSCLRLGRSRSLLTDAPVDVDRMSGTLRDHYEGTFLEASSSPTGEAAVPSICMHGDQEAVPWGRTASSMIVEYPEDDDCPVRVLWTPLTPCTGVYVPFYLESGSVPDAVSRGGTVGRRVQAPSESPHDEYDRESLWWRFHRLRERLDDEENRATERVVRETFDRLERSFADDAADVEERAAAAMADGDEDEAARLLRSFTAECVADVVSELEAFETASRRPAE